MPMRLAAGIEVGVVIVLSVFGGARGLYTLARI